MAENAKLSIRMRVLHNAYRREQPDVTHNVTLIHKQKDAAEKLLHLSTLQTLPIYFQVQKP